MNGTWNWQRWAYGIILNPNFAFYKITSKTCLCLVNVEEEKIGTRNSLLGPMFESKGEDVEFDLH